MEDIKKEDIIEPVTPTSEVAPTETEQDPLKTELERVQKEKPGRSELEKAQFSLRKTAERIAELGGDATAALGLEKPKAEPDDEDAPVTRAELQKVLAAQQAKTALQMADEIPDATERELAKHYLENRIVPSGDPHADLRDARNLVNGLRNKQILEEAARKLEAKTHPNGSGVPANSTAKPDELTAQELMFTKPPFNLTREQVIKSRQGPQ